MTQTEQEQTAAPSREGWWEDSVGILSDLIRMDTQIGGPGERGAAEWVAEFLSDVGVSSEIVESERGRATLVARVPGQDASLDPLLVQMHLDVVPAQPHEWTVHPLSGEVRDGCIWGRGAVDMKDMVASVLTVVRERLRAGRLPRRPLVLAFFADEENAGVLGAEWAVAHRPDLFEGCRVAIGEGGGYSVPLGGGNRVYPVHVAEKGWTALQVTAHAAPAHASRLYDENPVRVLGAAIGRLTHDRFPVHLTPEVEQLLRTACDVNGVRFDPDDPEAALPLLGASEGPNTASGLRHTAHATRLSAGYQSNVIPSSASAELDCRYLPGRWEEFLGELRAALGDGVEITELARTLGLTPVEGGEQDAVFAAALNALREEDPAARVSPFMLSGGTDATHLQQLGIECFGFAPLLLPEDLDFRALFHGIDERVPVDSLHFETRVLDRFLDLY
ncbi:MAG TPA: M20/M25/M40 family metallo-hydrolase [Segeticoccus sp.]|uniref:M20/M25/M40 family metallo-hydrolase n=1 Tax=Segeticoccus sp. TaxID=2706531 RepID=UPI002D7ED4E3|nr:M20/M25/M40 family metallo-hydrolase [Segeticoccus sp.]HET8600089.1 M20/M25/M40 family metallo-hydrolase [Segeticoccus sp.]